jgi:ethanolamine utilization protein EutN
MKIGRVINNIWATRKEESLTGLKLMIVQFVDASNQPTPEIVVAADFIGAGIGEKVLVAEGSSARQMYGLEHSPIDAVIVGIIDEEKKSGNQGFSDA